MKSPYGDIDFLWPIPVRPLPDLTSHDVQGLRMEGPDELFLKEARNTVVCQRWVIPGVARNIHWFGDLDSSLSELEVLVHLAVIKTKHPGWTVTRYTRDAGGDWVVNV